MKVDFLNFRIINQKASLSGARARKSLPAPSCASFLSFGCLDKDTFEKSSNIPEHTVIFDRNLCPVEAVVKIEKLDNLSYGRMPVCFSLEVNGDEIAHAKGASAGRTFNVSELYYEANKRKYFKGAGTELLKAIVQESKERGHEGRVSLFACYRPAPFVFYYKNNFVLPKSDIDAYPDLAYIDYAARNSMPVKDFSPNNALDMTLTPDGADALLSGKRLYEDRFCKKISTKKMNHMRYSAHLIQSPERDEYFVLILNESNKGNMYRIAAAIDARDKMHQTVVAKANNFYLGRDEEKYLDDAIEDAKEIIKTL